jgi:histidinol dehydrogenase
MSGGAIPVLAGTAARAWFDARDRASAGEEVRPAVEEILAQVRNGGDEALLAAAERFEGGRPAALRVPPERCQAELDGLTPELRASLDRAAANIRRFHAAQRRVEPVLEVMPGVRAWREFRPIERVGIYAPGGRAAYPSSVLMAAIPARLAGCPELVVASPAAPGAWPPGPVLAAAALVGADEVWAVGGAHAIAALAWGTESLQPVDKIFGPGGPWVNAAKLAAFGSVAVDLPAGPSEVVVWADETADPRWIAAERLAQAEHGPDSLSVAVLSDPAAPAAELEGLAARAAEATAAGLAGLSGGPTQASARASLAASAILVAEGEEEGAGWVNRLAGEHLVILRRDPRADLSRVAHAGSVFLGPWAPVAAGDYASGTNHVLPTGRRARAASGLGLDDFGRWVQVQEIDREGLAALAPALEALAEWEGLPAHAASVRVRNADGRDR